MIDQVKITRAKLKAAQDRQKSYTDEKHMDAHFEVGDHVFIKVLPWKKIMRFEKKEKLSLRHIMPYVILDRVGELAYRLDLSSELPWLHNVFYICMLRKYVLSFSYVIRPEQIEI